MNVAIMGASDKPDRYSYKAFKMLCEHGHTPFPVHPRLEEIEGTKVFKSVEEIGDPIDTITLYLGAQRQAAVADEILESGARRVIFNPGAENQDLQTRLEEKGIEAVEACTLVMLRTGVF